MFVSTSIFLHEFYIYGRFSNYYYGLATVKNFLWITIYKKRKKQGTDAMPYI